MVSYMWIDEVGKGKTKTAIAFTLLFKELFPLLECYGNVKIKMKGFHFTPYLVFPFSKFKNNNNPEKPIVLFLDDISNLRFLSGFNDYINATQRKLNLIILITSQYYTMIKREVRMTTTYLVNVNEVNDTMYFTLTDRENNITQHHINNISFFHDKYDTNFVVNTASKRNLHKEILKVSKNLDDLEQNLLIYYGKNVSMYEKYWKQLKKEFEK